MYWHASTHPDLLWEPIDTRARRFGIILTASPIAVYALAMLVAEVSPQVSLVLFFSVPLLYVLLVTVLRENADPRDEADDFT